MKKLLVALVGAALFVPSMVFSADVPDSASLQESDSATSIEDVLDLGALDEEVSLLSEAWVVTGTKEKRKAIDSPFSVFVLDRKQIDALHASDIGDLLKAVPGFDTFKIRDMTFGASEPGYASEFGSQYLVLIDGVSFGNRRNRAADWQTIPVQIDEIERIEYLPGAQSTLYGSYAAIGVLNIITTKANPETWDKEKPSALRARVGADGLQAYDFTYNDQSEKMNTTFWGSFRTIEDGDDPVNYVPPFFSEQGESRLPRGGFAVKNQLDDVSNLRVDFNYLKGNRDIYLPADALNPREDIQEMSAVGTYTRDKGDHDVFTVMVKTRNNSIVNDSFAQSQGRDDENMVEVRRQFKDKKDNIISLGGYYQVNSVKGPIVEDKEQNLYESSVNTLIELPLKDNQSIFAGINGYHSSYTETDLTYKLFYKKKTTEREAFRFGYSTSARGSDIFFAKINQGYSYPPPTFTPVRVIGGNPDLENEKFSFAEMSYEHRTTASSFQARAYTGKVKDRITGVYTGEPPVPYSGLFVFPAAFVNMEEDNDQFGLTTTWDRRFSDTFRTTLSYRYLRAKNGDGTTSFYSPKHSANAQIIYTPDDKLSLNLFTKTYSSYTTEDGMLAGTAPVAGHTKLDFSASLKTTKDGSQSLWFRINNVTDKKTVEAYTNAAFIPGAGYEIGRQITAGYSFRF